MNLARITADPIYMKCVGYPSDESVIIRHPTYPIRYYPSSDLSDPLMYPSSVYPPDNGYPSNNPDNALTDWNTT